MIGWHWHQLDNMQIICTSLKTDNHASTSPLHFYRLDALPAAQPTASKHWRYVHIWRRKSVVNSDIESTIIVSLLFWSFSWLVKLEPFAQLEQALQRHTVVQPTLLKYSFHSLHVLTNVIMNESISEVVTRVCSDKRSAECVI